MTFYRRMCVLCRINDITFYYFFNKYNLVARFSSYYLMFFNQSVSSPSALDPTYRAAAYWCPYSDRWLSPGWPVLLSGGHHHPSTVYRPQAGFRREIGYFLTICPEPGEWRSHYIRTPPKSPSNGDTVSGQELALGNVWTCPGSSYIRRGHRRPMQNQFRHLGLCFNEMPVSGIEPGTSAL